MGDGKESDSPDTTENDVDSSLDVIPLHSTNLLTVLDDEGTILYESPSIERVFGFDQDELVGESVSRYFHPDDRENVLRAFESIVNSAKFAVESVEYRHLEADGSYRWVESVASSNPTPEGHYVINTRDISDRLERERELERSNERLEKFASVVSHDLRSPLNVAKGRLELASEACDAEHLNEAEAALDRMETLIDDLLTLARTDERVQELEPVDFGALAETCWQSVAAPDATLTVDIDRSIHADRSSVLRLLENLMRNAVEHGGDTVRIGELEDGQGFYLADDGPGVPESEAEHIFEWGYTTKRDGPGFGLTIVREISEAHDWTIRLTESEAGGARFEIEGVKFV